MKILLFAGSLRKDSLNHKLLTIVAQMVSQESHEIDLVRLNEFPMPVYNEEVEHQGIPDSVKSLKARIEKVDALILATPTYNFAFSGVIKNTIDWLSRDEPQPFAKKPILIVGASPGPTGGVLGVTTLKGPLEGLGAFIFPAVFTLPAADKAFDSDGRLSNPTLTQKLNKLVANYLSYAKKLTV